MHAGDEPAPAGGGRAVALGASRRRSIASPGLAAARRTSPVSPCTRFDMSIRDRCVSGCLEVVRNVKGTSGSHSQVPEFASASRRPPERSFGARVRKKIQHPIENAFSGSFQIRK